jgi:hypothetical protein
MAIEKSVWRDRVWVVGLGDSLALLPTIKKLMGAKAELDCGNLGCLQSDRSDRPAQTSLRD